MNDPTHSRQFGLMILGKELENKEKNMLKIPFLENFQYILSLAVYVI